MGIDLGDPRALPQAPQLGVNVDARAPRRHTAMAAFAPRPPMSTEYRVATLAIVGMGAFGLAALERVVAHALSTDGGESRAVVHVVEPRTPGEGVYSEALPDYLIMNTPCGQISMHPQLEEETLRPYQLSLFEWATREGYRWVGDSLMAAPAGRQLTPHDFVPRRIVGRYLKWYYNRLLEAAPPGLQIWHHRVPARDLLRTSDGRERLILDSGEVLDVDHVVLTLGHLPSNPPGMPLEMLPYNEAFELGDSLTRSATVGVAGMGLAATDVVMALTVGRGGRFEETGGKLGYVPNGTEPKVRLFSRSGLPQCAKAVGMRDITSSYTPGIWTDAEVARRREQALLRGRKGLNWARDLLPLLTAEMELQYYAQASLQAEGPAASAEVRGQLLHAWETGQFGAESAKLSAKLGQFKAIRHFYPEAGRRFGTSEEYADFVSDLMARDLAEALRPGGASPVKMAYEVLRFIRDGIREAVEFGGLDLESHQMFFGEMRGRINRVVQGPPAARMRQLVALVEAGILSYPYGPNPQVTARRSGSAILRSTRLETAVAERVDLLICGFFTDPTLGSSDSSLVRNLVRSGRLCEMRVEGQPVGSVALSPNCHPLAADGSVQEAVWVFGSLTEGARYFTNVIPSPGSRRGPFLDAAKVAQAMRPSL